MKINNQKNIIVFVMNLFPRYVEAIRELEKKTDKKYRIMLLWDSKVKRPDTLAEYDILIECDFSKPGKIAEALLTHQEELLAITCRQEQHLARFAQVIPNVPYLRTPTTESLNWAADKYQMRRRLRLFDPKNAPRFAKVLENTKKERTRLTEKVGFPMIIKPANLMGARFVTVCYHEEELEKTLRTLFTRLKKAYQNDLRKELPTIIAEEYMEGLMFAVDSYVNSRGIVEHCPMVRVKTGREIGHNDPFFSYLQTTPTGLKKETIANAHQVVETAIHALGLRSVTAHTELMKVDDEWKVIEVGARCGGFRDILHPLSCDINHTANDITTRITGKVTIPKKCKGYATAMKWYAKKEGEITAMQGVKKIEDLESFHKITVNKKLGDRAIFAKNGGKSIFNLFLYNKDRSKLLADIRRVEQTVKIKVENKRVRTQVVTKATKKVAPKKVTKTTKAAKTTKKKS